MTRLNDPVAQTRTEADGSFHLHSGGGIVADSTPEQEQAELEVKVHNIREALARP